jgi:hypothetical protein
MDGLVGHPNQPQEEERSSARRLMPHQQQHAKHRDGTRVGCHDEENKPSASSRPLFCAFFRSRIVIRSTVLQGRAAGLFIFPHVRAVRTKIHPSIHPSPTGGNTTANDDNNNEVATAEK